MNELLQHIGEDGSFSESFIGAARTIAGEGFEESKVFDDVHDVDTLTKNYAHAQKKLGERAENVINKPGENASEEDIAAYHQSLLQELGPAEKPEDYEFNTEGLPEGFNYSKELENHWREFFHSNKWPVSMVNQVAEKMKEISLQQFQSNKEAQERIFKESCVAFDKDFKGDSAVEDNRLAFQAIKDFGTDELIKVLQEAGVYDDPTNHDKWQKAGFTPDQRRVWINIARATKRQTNIPNEGSDQNKNNINKVISDIYKNSPELTGKK